MKLSSLTSFLGFVLLMAATYCPLLRPFHLFNMDLYDLSRPFGMALLLIAVIGILGVVLNQTKIVKATAWLSLGFVLAIFLAAFLKINASFSFIPFKSIAGFLSKQIRFKWGWFLLFGGPIVALIGSMGKQTKYSRK